MVCTEKQCLTCNSPLEYVADFGAPGIGQCWRCTGCQEEFAVVGGRVYPIDDMVHVPEPEFFR